MVTFLRNVLRLFFSFSIFISTGFITGGCSDAEFTKRDPELYPAGTTTESFFIPLTQSSKKVDILIVDDNSGSMEIEQSRLGQRLDSFVTGLGGSDWQIGVTTTDMSNGNFGIQGSLVDLEGAPGYILDVLTPNRDQVFRDTIERDETFGCNQSGLCPDGTEQPFGAIVSAIAKRSGDNSGFFRNDADLAVIVLTDEDESGSTTGTDVISAVRSAFGSSKAFTVFGLIILENDLTCLAIQKAQQGGGGSVFAAKVQDLVDRTGGLTGSLCDTDYGPTLQSIGQRVVEYQNSLELKYEPNKDSVEIQISPDQAVTHKIRGNKVSFSPGLLPGSRVDISYTYGILEYQK